MLIISFILFAGATKTNREFRFNPAVAQLPLFMHSRDLLRLQISVENSTVHAFYPPNCSVSLLISLFKSLSFFRCSSIFSTECKTVV